MTGRDYEDAHRCRRRSAHESGYAIEPPSLCDREADRDEECHCRQRRDGGARDDENSRKVAGPSHDLSRDVLDRSRQRVSREQDQSDKTESGKRREQVRRPTDPRVDLIQVWIADHSGRLPFGLHAAGVLTCRHA